jgi:hypothetical protein
MKNFVDYKILYIKLKFSLFFYIIIYFFFFIIFFFFFLQKGLPVIAIIISAILVKCLHIFSIH